MDTTKTLNPLPHVTAYSLPSCPLGHPWRAPDNNQANYEPQCAKCAKRGTSPTVRRLHKYFTESQLFPYIATGNQQHLPIAWDNRKTMTVDILITTHKGIPTVIEYDSLQLPDTAARTASDTAKTLALLNAGYQVIRIREKPLTLLPIPHDNLGQLLHVASSHKRDTLRLADRIAGILS